MSGAPADIVVVTGASRGIGRAAALAFARRGCTVALLGRPGERLDDTVAAVRGLGAAVRACACDVASPDEVARAADEALREVGTPRVVVNNAGIVRRVWLHDRHSGI